MTDTASASETGLFEPDSSFLVRTVYLSNSPHCEVSRRPSTVRASKARAVNERLKSEGKAPLYLHWAEIESKLEAEQPPKRAKHRGFMSFLGLLGL